MEAILEQINSVGKTFIEFAVPMLIQSSVLIIILLAIDMILRNRIRAIFRYWIWMIVLVKLILPPSLSLPTSPAYWFGHQIHNPLSNEQIPEKSQTYSSVVHNETSVYQDIATVYSAASSPEIEQDSTDSIIRPELFLIWQGGVFLIWLAALLIMIALLIQKAFFVKQLVARSQDAGDEMMNILERARLQMGIRKKISLKLSDTVLSPSVCGLIRPTILIPKIIAERIDSNNIKSIFLHELAHIKRYDLLVNLLQTILQIVYIYNPLLWVANYIIRNVREQAVDEMVLVTMGKQAEEYPKTLLNISKFSFGSATLSLRLIGVTESRKALFTRIRHITSRPFPIKAKLGVIGIIAVVTVAAVLLPMAKGEKASMNQNITSDQQQRIYELIYILRHYVIDVKTEQWVAAIQELTEIGSDAVPALVDELERTKSGRNIRALAFTLRAIGDPRAVPALIHVLPNSPSIGSDMGVNVSDPNLLDFMNSHQAEPQVFDLTQTLKLFMFHRPVWEVTSALEKITGHSEGHEHFHTYDSDGNRMKVIYEITPEMKENQRIRRIEVADRWQKWWDEHWGEFVTEDELETVYIAFQKDEDLVEAVGLGKFGQPFPTGKDVTLGPVEEVILPTHIFYDSKSFLDLDTGRRFSNLEGVAPENRSDFSKWYEQVGVDIAGDELHLIDDTSLNGLYNCGIKTWQIDNSRWDSFEKEIQSGEPLDLGTIGPRSDFLPIDSQTREFKHMMRPVTFLFNTLHGASGILQITEPIDDPNGTHVKYRLIEPPEHIVSKQVQEIVIYSNEFSEESILGPVIEKVVYKATSETDSALDLDTGELSTIPQEMRGPYYPSELSTWMETGGYDVCILAFKYPYGEPNTLTTCKVRSISVSPTLWNTITPSQLKELLWKVDVPDRYSVQGGMYVGGGSIPKTYPVVFLFKTSQGGMGILQIAGRTDDGQGLIIRYRLLEESY